MHNEILADTAVRLAAMKPALVTNLTFTLTLKV